MLDLIYLLIFLAGMYFLLKHWFNVKNAVILSQTALYPKTKDEYSSLLIPNEWKEMEAISKNTRAYQIVKWGTAAAMILMGWLIWMVFFTDWLEYAYLNVIYMVLVIMNFVKHQGSLLILPEGLVLNGSYRSFKQIKRYEVEKITLSHPLYGLHARINNAYKLSIIQKNLFGSHHYVVVEDQEHLKRITDLLGQHGIHGKTRKDYLAVGEIKSS
ncbi:hypothetical protein [Metabacillus sp. FJAT-52054]|uniref:DUF304 domain-containing protein n=1 Tax=Metabacillus sediminis TaxID=3117746 RepID=A0ABZ2NK65_9BACI